MSSQLTIPTLCKTIRTLVSKGDAAIEKGEQFYIAAGQHLKELKERRPADVSWAFYIEERCSIGRRRADELIQIADGRTTLAKTRADKAESMRQSRIGSKTGTTGAGKQSSPSVSIEKYGPEEQEEEELWVDTPDEDEDPRDTALRNKAGFLIAADASRRSAFYDGPLDDDVLDAARRVLTAWEELIAAMEDRYGSGAVP